MLMSLSIVIIITLATILLYWYYQLNIDTNEAYMIPYNVLNKNKKCYSLKSIKIKKNVFSKFRYTIGINKSDFKDDEWEKKVSSICKEIDFPKHMRKEIIENSKKSKSISVGARMDNENISYKMHIWHDFDKDTSDSGTRYDWNISNNETSNRRYSCETELSGEIINKQIIKYSTYDIQLYNAISSLISDILDSPLREELSSPVILYSKDDNGIDAITIRVDDYNAKIKQVESHIIQISDYLNQKKEVEKWIKNESDMMLAGITFGFDKDKKFYFGIHNYAIH